MVLIDASGASSVKGLSVLYQSAAGTSTHTWNYADGGVTVTGQSGLSLSHDNVLSYGLRSIDQISYGTLDWKTGGTVLALDSSHHFNLADTKVDTSHIQFTDNSLKALTQAGDYTMTLLDTKGNKTLSSANLTGGEGRWTLSNALTGRGAASLDDQGNVIYRMDVSKGSVSAAEGTHSVLVANEAALGTLASGRERMEGVLQGLTDEEGGFIPSLTLEDPRTITVPAATAPPIPGMDWWASEMNRRQGAAISPTAFSMNTAGDIITFPMKEQQEKERPGTTAADSWQNSWELQIPMWKAACGSAV